MALGTVASEQRLVPVLVGMTGCAVERLVRRRPAVAAECAPGPVQRAALFRTAQPCSVRRSPILARAGWSIVVGRALVPWCSTWHSLQLAIEA